MAAGEFRREGLHEAFVDGIGERQGLGIAEDFDGLAGGIDDDPAIATARQVLLKRLNEPGIQFAVEVFRKLSYHFSTVQACFALLKCRLNLLRSMSRARSRRDFTAGTESSRALAVSSVESSSISRSITTIL